MPGIEEFVQRTVHALEAGHFSVWIKRGLIAASIIALATYYLWPGHFRGLATSQAMDQAQIGRGIASGQGWRTNLVRPRAIGQLQDHGKDVTQEIWYDTYNAPLPPLVDAISLLPVKAHLVMNPRDVVYTGDRAIAAMSILLFLCSVTVLFFTARRLFDSRLALLACGLVLLCDALWQYSLSGLPQMLLLLLFNLTIYALVRAIENHYADRSARIPLIATGIGFGLLALTHALTVWMFLPILIVAFFFFRPRVRAGAIMLGAFAAVYLPWLIRTYAICGNPAGVAFYSVLDGVVHPESGWMRRMNLDMSQVGVGAFRNKMVGNLIGQAGHIFEYFGLSIVAVMFFAGLLYAFKRRETATLRWMLLAMWGGAVLGMALYGINEEVGVAANQLHLIFIPLMTCYGLAYLLVQWNRLDIGIPFARAGFLALLYFLCTLPMIFRALSPVKTFVHWPPYFPGAISVLHDWMKPAEVTASDMPWAVAWYANRRSLWVPDAPKNLLELSDYNVLGAPINGLYLTPISGTENKFRDIVKGEYHDWAGIIERVGVSDQFPLTWKTLALGLENECIFFSDHDRASASSAP
jgi:4-amino-4-deoxy-L-arabinose transferase-like glycosyltransferase